MELQSVQSLNSDMELYSKPNGVAMTNRGAATGSAADASWEPATPQQEQREQKRQLSLCRIALFGLAGPPLQMTGNVAAFYFSIYLLEVARLSPAYVSIISFSGRAWDAVTDPLIGLLLSCTNTRFGKTRPWILGSSLCGSCLFLFMWWPVAAAETQAGKFAYYLLMHLVYCTLVTCYHIPYTSATVLLSPHSADRDAATAARIACELLFTIVGSAAFGAVIGSKRIATECGNFSTNGTADMLLRASEERDSYKLAAGIISLIYLSCGIVGFLGIKERVASVRDSSESFASTLRRIGEVITFKPYVALMMAFLFMSLGIQTIQANLGLFTTHRLKIGWHMTFGFMCVLVVATLCVPLMHLLNQRIGKKKVFIIGVMIVFPCLLLTQLMEPKTLFLYYLVTSLSGVTISVAMLQPWSMLPDVIEVFYKRHGDRMEATFYSLYAFFTKFAAGISLAVSQLALWLSNYDSNACEQPESVSNTLRLLMGPGPIACLLVSMLIIICFYRVRPVDNAREEPNTQSANETNIHVSRRVSELQRHPPCRALLPSADTELGS
ncbi:hypothetical protein BOX15_Mlig030794g1 [Macrostomum lignano]|uniref:MFS domain-containing protein n=1 Tax=Macrostomum lignano TaxID=282301 RepID=A0A267FKT5_9PLAT|nr:hypothetical protein BOX15_Mlig030794g1 [Macrostomum lignano]